MDQPELLLLELLRNAITDTDLHLAAKPDKQTWQKMIRLANIHDVIPMVIRAVWKLDQIHNIGSFFVVQAQKKTVFQAQKSADFLLLYEYLSDRDLHPVVMKGIVLRDIYPQPEHRTSTDEDILIDPTDFPQYHEAFLKYGLTPVSPSADLLSEDEVSYESKEMHLYIEVHKTPFLTDTEAFSDFNSCFQGARERSITQNIYNTEISTLAQTDHLIYLILHALKHFLYSGFGIRQVCDIILFSEHYRQEIDWSVVSAELERMHAMDFTRAVYKIGLTYLLPENHLQAYIDSWDCMQIDEEPLLHDIMDGGLYGASSIARLHSSNLTLHAAKQRDNNISQRSISTLSSIFHTVFLPLDKMSGRFPYLRKAPILLPVAWCQRVFGYLKERISARLSKHSRRNNKSRAYASQASTAAKNTIINSGTAESIRLGRSRLELFKLYGIIK